LVISIIPLQETAMAGINAELNSQFPILIAGARRRVQDKTKNVHAHGAAVAQAVLEFLHGEEGFPTDKTVDWLQGHLADLQRRYLRMPEHFKLLPDDETASAEGLSGEELTALYEPEYDVNFRPFRIAIDKAQEIYIQHPVLNDSKHPSLQVGVVLQPAGVVPLEFLQRFEKLEKALVDGFESENQSREETAHTIRQALLCHTKELANHGEGIAAAFGHGNMRMEILLDRHRTETQDMLSKHNIQLSQIFGGLNDQLKQLITVLQQRDARANTAVGAELVETFVQKVDEVLHKQPTPPTEVVAPTPVMENGHLEETPVIPFVSLPPTPTEVMQHRTSTAEPIVLKKVGFRKAPTLRTDPRKLQQPILRNVVGGQQWWKWSLSKFGRGPRLLVVDRWLHRDAPFLQQIQLVTRASSVEYLNTPDQQRLERINRGYYDVVVIMPDSDKAYLQEPVARRAVQVDIPVARVTVSTPDGVVAALLQWAATQPRIPGIELCV
jgi:hypothetical protein